MDITTALPTAEAILELEAEELAGYLLEHLNGQANDLHLGNLLGGGINRHYKNDSRVDRALMEAWAWLVREGLLVEKAGANGWHFISRRGHRVRTRSDLHAYRRSSVLPRASLHPVIAERVWSAFVRGDYDTAVFQAYKEVEVAVRAAGGFKPEDLGTKLMSLAFKAGVGPLTDRSAPEAEQLATVNIFNGAIGLFKNPTSHRHVPIDDPSAAAELIGFASFLMRRIDSIKNGDGTA